MANKIKEGILYHMKRKYVIILLVVFCVSIPFVFAEGQTFGESAENIANSIIGTTLFVIATSSYVFATLSDWFLRLSLEPDFITATFTPQYQAGLDMATNPYGLETGNRFVGYGWTIIRDFVNMFFIIILVIIGLSTSLQVETYKWQKTLPRLVLVALLINFTPAILGVFIDVSNTIMNFFIGSQDSFASESVFVSRMRALYEPLTARLDGVAWSTYSAQAIDPLAQMIIFTFFNTIVGITYFLYGALFALRYVALWLLVIISPFGFFCYILPATQDFFKTWWKWFIGWSIAGVAGVLFLHLGETMHFYIGDQISILRTHHAGLSIDSFAYIFEEVIPLLFSLFGIFVAIFASTAGAKGIISGLQVASGSVKKSMPNMPRSSFKERGQAAGAAIKNAFSTGSLSSPTTTASSASKKTTTTTTPSMHRRQTVEQAQTTSIKSSPTPVTEVVLHATKGTGDAAMEIAADFEKTGVFDTAPSSSNSSSPNEINKSPQNRSGSLSGLSSKSRTPSADNKNTSDSPNNSSRNLDNDSSYHQKFNNQ